MQLFLFTKHLPQKTFSGLKWTTINTSHLHFVFCKNILPNFKVFISRKRQTTIMQCYDNFKLINHFYFLKVMSEKHQK